MKRKTYLAPYSSVVEMKVEAIIAQSPFGDTEGEHDLNYGGESSGPGIDGDVREGNFWGDSSW